MPDDWHERLRAVMITTYGAGRDRLVRSNQCASLYVEDTGGGVSPLLPVCHEAALAPEEGGVPACGEDRRVASGTEGSLKWRSDWCMKASMVCVEDVADAQNCATELPWSNEEMDAYCYQSP